ncbi:cadherin-5 [Betta splendens]|uniref:Cadherin-5 n=1 Tax=Betta splendens TaxID=158456 RepID=A0A6P7PEU5_BETSP|nr:cadherin-5 [Betta splendens]
MMARCQLWTAGLMVTMVFSISLTVAQDSGLPDAEAKQRGSGEVVRRESNPLLSRKKRHWIWNSLYVEEEKPVSSPYKIGQLKSSHKLEVMKFEIEGEGANTIFLVGDNGDLLVTRALDREEKSTYNLTAKLYDGNHKLIEDSGEFVVRVTDINDNIPIFPKEYKGSIMERSPIGTKVVEVTATDADDPTSPNGELRYSLINDGEGAFEIQTISGLISSKINTLDRETKSQYVVVVKAQDMRGLPSGSTATTSVTITITDVNDNMASFSKGKYMLQVPEDHKLKEKISTLELTDRDQIQNKEPIVTILGDYSRVFGAELNPGKNANLILKQPLDYETMKSYTFTVKVQENLNLRLPADNVNQALTTAMVIVEVLDVDEPPVFSQPNYTFPVMEEQLVNAVGVVTARDPDQANKRIRYSVLQKDCPVDINPHTGQLFSLRTLDREAESTHRCQVKAQEEPSGLESFVEINIKVQDINDNKPELMSEQDIFVCENDMSDTVIGTLKATDKDEQPASFAFKLATKSSNFSLYDHGNGSASVLVLRGPFSLDDPKDYSVDVSISDGGRPAQTSVTKLVIKSCRCDARRRPTQCKAGAQKVGVSVHALIAILLCILTILVIVILFVMRKRYQKDSLANMKNSGEIHEQLVTYDEEGGGEMDTNGYDVSILTSACHDGSLLRHADHHPHPSLYAVVQKPHQAPPTACKGDMAAMIEVKKDEADHDRDGIPYDTLHVYGYEGPESLAGSLSSLDSSSTGSNLDYDFLSDWGPRFRTLAELYGVDGSDYYHQY